MTRLLLVLAVVACTAGCVMPDGDVFPIDAASTTAPLGSSHPGLTVKGAMDGGGDVMSIDAVAHNERTNTYRVSSICKEPWSDSMTGPSGPVQRREPIAVCDAFGLRYMEPGEDVRSEVSWNGTLWDDGRARYVRAPSGEYVWRVTFEVYRGSQDEYGDRERIPLDFRVTVN